MVSAEPNELVRIFNELESAKGLKSKSDLLGKAKHFILNRMSDDDIAKFFVQDANNFKNLFLLDVWTRKLDETNGIVEFTEPYDIIERILSLFKSIDDLVNDASTYDKILYLFEQGKDEKVKHLLVKRLTELVSGLLCFIYNLKTSNEN